MYINGPWCINGCNTNGLDYGVVKSPPVPPVVCMTWVVAAMA